MKQIIFSALLVLGTYHTSQSTNNTFNAKDTNGNTLLHTTTAIQEARYLLAHGSPINAKNNNGCTFLHYAVLNRDPYLVQLALDYHADVNVQNNDGITPLMNTVIAGSLAIVKLLCSHGADVTLSDQEKRTALDYADDALTAQYSLEKAMIKQYLIKRSKKHHYKDEL
jgi:ankyrin repeat protein